MNEVWLRANSKPFVPLSAALVVAACASAAAGFAWFEAAGFGRAAAATTAVAAILAALLLAYLSRKPRLVFDGRRVLFYVRFGAPVAVPVELVEAFLLGRGPTFLPGRDHDPAEVATLVVRIAERAEEFNKVDTAPMLAGWCGHYVTLRGTWTEPLGLDVVNRLNQRLYDVQHSAAGAARSTT